MLLKYHLNICLYNKVLFVHAYLNKESCLGKGEEQKCYALSFHY